MVPGLGLSRSICASSLPSFHRARMRSTIEPIEPLERAKARERQREGGRKKAASGNFPEAKGRAVDKVARVVGKSGKTLQKARARPFNAGKFPRLLFVIASAPLLPSASSSAFRSA